MTTPRLAGAGLALLALLLLPGCGSMPGASAPPATTAPAAGAATTAPHSTRSLVTERRWLQSWFKGTPVRIHQRANGDVDVAVPLQFSFDTGQTQVLPALGAVLDKVAETLKRVPQAQLVLIAAPADGSDGGDLARRRAAAVREQMLARGVADAQLGEPRAATAAAVQLQLALAAP